MLFVLFPRYALHSDSHLKKCFDHLKSTALGAAYAAGLAVGVWKDLEEIKKLWEVKETFTPSMSEKERLKNLKGWDKAVQRSFDWVEDESEV